MPGEDEQSLIDTYNFIMNNPLGFISLTYFTPLPGSFFWEDDKYLEYGTLRCNDYSKFNMFSGMPYVPNDLTSEQMKYYRDKMYKDFLFSVFKDSTRV